MCPNDRNVCNSVHVPIITLISAHLYLFVCNIKPNLQNVSVHNHAVQQLSVNSLTLLSMGYVQFNTVYD